MPDNTFLTQKGTPLKQPADVIRRSGRLRRGQPPGSDHLGMRSPSALAVAFKNNKLDWKKDFADSILKNDVFRMQFWERMLPHMWAQRRNQINGGLTHSLESRKRTSQAALDNLAELEKKDLVQ